MALIAKETGGDFKSIEPGTYVARSVRLIDIGTQHGEYQGSPTSRHQIVIMWEFPLELIEGGEYDGQPYTMSKFYTLSLGEKANLRKDLEAWRGKAFTKQELEGFDLRNILGKPCMVTVVAGGDGKKNKVGAVTSMVKGMQCPAQISPTVEFDIENWDQQIFDSFSDKMKEIIMRSDEAQARNGGHVKDDSYEGNFEEGDPGFSDDIPF